MPRINRNDVQFDGPDGKVWLARFVHHHNDKDGILHLIGDKLVHGRHLTICKLGHKDSHVFLQGFSLCSMKEDYNWKFGLKQALNRALEKGRFCYQTDIDIWGKVGDKDALIHKRGDFIGLKPEYGIIINSFYREMPIKAYWPHNETLVEVYAVPAEQHMREAEEVLRQPSLPMTHHVINRIVRPIHGVGATEEV